MSDTKQKQQQTFVAKLVGTVAAIAAAFVAQQVINQAWKAKTGHKPPKAEDEGEAGLGELVAATAITGAIIGVGTARTKFSAIKWGVAARIVWAWIFTLPAAGAVGALTFRGSALAFGFETAR